MLLRHIASALRPCGRRLHVDFAFGGVPAPYHRKKELLVKQQGALRIGDDACFVVSGQNSNIGLGVADGVGGWREHGFDPGFVSSGLMGVAEELAKQGGWDVDNPVKWLADSHDLMLERCDDTILGSSTICLCSLDVSSSQLYAANLGDSGLLVLSSSGELRLKSESRQVEFNAPLQLAAPAELANHYANHTHASFYTQKLNAGDFVVLASDGLWDNLQLKDLADFLAKEYHPDGSLQDLVQKLLLKTKELSESEEAESPFAMKAKAAGYQYKGGKPDDITVLLLTVKN